VDGATATSATNTWEAVAQFGLAVVVAILLLGTFIWFVRHMITVVGPARDAQFLEDMKQARTDYLTDIKQCRADFATLMHEEREFHRAEHDDLKAEIRSLGPNGRDRDRTSKG